MLSRRTQINIALLCLVAVLAAALLLPHQQPSLAPLPTLTRLDAETIDRIRIVNRDGESIQFEKATWGWSMLVPFPAKANQTRIAGLLKITSTPTYLELRTGDQDLSLFGLVSPVASVQLNDTLLQFGATEPVHYRRYVLVGDMIGLIDDGFYHHLSAKPRAFLAPEQAADSNVGAD